MRYQNAILCLLCCPVVAFTVWAALVLLRHYLSNGERDAEPIQSILVVAAMLTAYVLSFGLLVGVFLAVWTLLK